MQTSRTLALGFALALFGWGYHHYFVHTLSLTEIVGPTGSAIGDTLTNLFDFDTGLTRWDVYRLASRCDDWNGRMVEVEAISDPGRRETARQELFAEMMRDPSFKKVAQKTFGLGAKAAGAMAQAIATAW